MIIFKSADILGFHQAKALIPGEVPVKFVTSQQIF